MFIGNWISIDPGDGSNQQLSISENNDVYDVNYYDDAASSCDLDGDGNAIAATGEGLGAIKGNVLGIDFSCYCQTDPQRFLTSTHVDYTYNETTNTIEDGSATWSRP